MLNENINYTDEFYSYECKYLSQGTILMQLEQICKRLFMIFQENNDGHAHFKSKIIFQIFLCEKVHIK